MLVAVATTLVRLARSKIVSAVIGSRTGSTARARKSYAKNSPLASDENNRAGEFLFAISA